MKEVTLDEVYKNWIKYKVLFAAAGLTPCTFGVYCEILKEGGRYRIT